jgi:hypothetical protein
MIQPIPIALLFAFVMFVCWRISGRRAFSVLSVLWLSYAVYEYFMYTLIFCSGECNIRVDLLLIYPVLLGGTVWLTVASAVRAIQKLKKSFER